MRKAVLVLFLCLTLSGCASWIARPTEVVLLPEERIFTIPAGQVMKVTLDKREMEMTFPYEMKMVSPTVLVRQEEKLNDALLKKVKADAGRNKALGLVGGVIGCIAFGLGIFFKAKKWLPNLKANVEIK